MKISIVLKEDILKVIFVSSSGVENLKHLLLQVSRLDDVTKLKEAA